MTREPLPSRRGNLSFDFTYPPDQAATGQRFTATVGFYPDGRLGELFLRAGKSEAAMESIARDLAVVTSIAIQHGAPIETIQKALTQFSDGRPAGPLGVMFGHLERIIADMNGGDDRAPDAAPAAAGVTDL